MVYISIELKQLSENCGPAEYEMLQGIENNENGFSNPVFGMAYEQYLSWLKREDGYSRNEGLPEGWIPQTTYFLYVDGTPVGIGRIRHRADACLESIGAGSLGYGIAERFRSKGYGNVLFAGLIRRCIEFGYREITLFPFKSNMPTIKVMLKNNGRIAGSFNDEKYIVHIPIG